MAYNLLAIARAIHLRRDELVGWQALRDWLRDAIAMSGLLPPEPADPAPG